MKKFWDGTAVQANLITLDTYASDPGAWTRSTLDFLKWLANETPPMLANVDWVQVPPDQVPKAMAARLKGVNTRVDNITSKAGDLEEKIKVIEEAHVACQQSSHRPRRAKDSARTDRQ